MPKEQWDAERFGQFCVQPAAYAELKAELLKLCRKSGACTYQQREALRRFGLWLNSFEPHP